VSDDSSKSGSQIIGGLLNKAVESILAPALVAFFITIGVAQSEKLEDQKNWRVWVILIGIFLVVTFGGEALRRFIARWRVPEASGPKIGLLVARLSGDKRDDSLRETVREAIKKELGEAIEIILWPEPLRLGDGRDSDDEARARAKAQKWLASKRCDLLLWGRVKGDKTLSLRFTPASGSATAAESYGLTAETLELPLKFLSNLGSAIAARVVTSAASAVNMRGHYLVPMMRALAERFEPIISRLNPAFDADTRGSLLHSYALVRATIGEQAGSNDDLTVAIETFRQSLKERTRERMPLAWARTQNDLGNALWMLGERESGTARLEEAVTAYREALKEWTRERAPLDLATTQNNLGNALLRVGERESGTARLEEAVTAYRDALKERTRERVPLDWAMALNNLGTALARLGERESGTVRLEEAVTTYRDALKERTRERVPLDWATTQNNLGNALLRVGEREGGTARLEEAVTAYRDALKEWTRERVPLDWATALTNLGSTLLTLGERGSGTARLEEAVTAFRDALKEKTRERVPLDWAMSTGNQGVALMRLAERRSDSEMARRASAQIEAAFATVRDGGHAPNASYYEAQLKDARALVSKLSEQ
jgi:tetratricopeptide (TPR) repeat protein